MSHEQSNSEQNVTEVVQNLYCDNYKISWKEIKKMKLMERHPTFLDQINGLHIVKWQHFPSCLTGLTNPYEDPS